MRRYYLNCDDVFYTKDLSRKGYLLSFHPHGMAGGDIGQQHIASERKTQMKKQDKKNEEIFITLVVQFTSA